MSSTHSLANQFLIAMPGMLDPNFSQTVTFLFEHNAQGAMGIVVNRPGKMLLGEVFEQYQLPCENPLLVGQNVLQGGPLKTDQGFVVHRTGGHWEYSVSVSEHIQITTSRDILASMARGEGPQGAVIALGYAGWAAGQLEIELTSNAWITVPANERVLFDLPLEQRWRAAAGLIGIDLSKMSPDAGHA